MLYTTDALFMCLPLAGDVKSISLSGKVFRFQDWEHYVCRIWGSRQIYIVEEFTIVANYVTRRNEIVSIRDDART